MSIEPTTKLTGLRLRTPIHKEFKSVCDSNKVSISKVLAKLIRLFLDDNQLQERVLREVQMK